MTASRILFSILGGINAVMYLFTPVLLATIWINTLGENHISGKLFYIVALASTFYRALKIGGFVDDEELLKRLLRGGNGRRGDE